MGATAHLKAISPDLLDIFIGNPGLIEPFLCGLPPSLPPGFPAELGAQMANNLDDPARTEWLEAEIAAVCPQHKDTILSQARLPGLDLDKFWKELAPIIAGDGSQQSPLGRCITGGTPLGKSLGYGPARFLSHIDVAQSCAALEGIDNDMFKLRAQSRGLPVTSAEFLWTVFSGLRQYYRQATDDQKSMLLSMA